MARVPADKTKDPMWKESAGLQLNKEHNVKVKVEKPQGPAVVELDENIDPNSEIAELVRTGLIASDGVVQGEQDELPASAQVFRRKLKRMVEVPCTRKVKVPVVTKKIVDTTERRMVKTFELETYDEWKEVEEKYTVTEEVECVRNKQIWVKKVIPEKYTKKVEIEKTRMVKIAVPVTKEVEVWKEVDVPIQVEEPCEVMEENEIIVMRPVEFEGYQEIQLEPIFKKQPTKINNSMDQGQYGKKTKRIKGREYDLDDERLDDIDTDSDTDDDTVEVVDGGTEIKPGDHRMKRVGKPSLAAAKRAARVA